MAPSLRATPRPSSSCRALSSLMAEVVHFASNELRGLLGFSIVSCEFLLSIHWDIFLIMGVLGLLHTHSYIIATKPLYVGKNWESGTGNSKWIFC